MEFKNFKEALQNNFKIITNDVEQLFEVNVDKDEMWNLYLDSFPKGTNEMFRERREYDCSCCRQFIKNIGNVVAIKDGKVVSIWDMDIDCTTFKPVADALSNYIHSKDISDVYVSKFKKIGTDKNHELINGDVHIWEHFYLELPSKFVDKSSRSEGDIKGSFKSKRDVFKRSLDEITEESVLTILELISSNSLYRGKEWEQQLKTFLQYKQEYSEIFTEDEKDLYIWIKTSKVGDVIGRMRNTSIGTLLVNLSEGMDLETAVGKFEFIVGDGYKRKKPIFTERMLNEARKFMEENGYLPSLPRRLATLNDITVNNILFSNKDSVKRMKGGMDVFEQMSSEISVNPKKFSKVEEISIEDFISNVLPTSTSVEALLENNLCKNMVSLITAKDKNSKSMFKWDNNFSWAYSGNIADSSMKENVKNAGGKVDGVLRFSIQWNDEKEDRNDLDAHCIEPNGNLIYFGRCISRYTGGSLDVDIMRPKSGVPAVENITWANRDKMEDGIYKVLVHNYSNRGGRTGFKAEVEFDGEIHSFDYNKELRQDEKVVVAEITLKDGKFTIKELLPSNVSSKEVWNLQTNQFIPVSTILLSPNYWDEQKGNGNRHYMFMLKDCINSEEPNCFYNEFLNQELFKQGRVMEALGSKLKVETVDNQLSGLGFSETKRNELTVKVKGKIQRMFKIKF